MPGFWCRKRREQMDEPCSDCVDCPAELKSVSTLEEFIDVIERRME